MAEYLGFPPLAGEMAEGQRGPVGAVREPPLPTKQPKPKTIPAHPVHPCKTPC